VSAQVRLILTHGEAAFVLMVKHATFAQTGAAGGAIEFVAVANVIAALTALYGSIDELKHPTFSLRGSRSMLMQLRQMRLNTLPQAGQ
jgi:hypothetical protein